MLDPASTLAQSILAVFESFEDPTHILVFASRDGKVTAELKRLEMNFFVNLGGLLQSHRLGAVITQNQDAGTWYGLRSKILIQSIANRRQRSILVPLGPIRITKDGIHVAIEIGLEEGIYLTFSVNDVLGRIDCPPEPKLLYMKALLHAYTSHFICDALTGRTGTEEALYLLQTGSYKPWQPLTGQDMGTLQLIAEASPQRGYYPKESKCMETVVWQPHLTITIQDERYRALVAEILQRSADLSFFFVGPRSDIHTDEHSADCHLAVRAVSRLHGSRSNTVDIAYFARDTRLAMMAHKNAFDITKLLHSDAASLPQELNLSSLLHDAPVIGGYDKVFQKTLISDQIMLDVKANWGALAQKALQFEVEDRHSLAFLLSTIAFSDDTNMDLLRMLVAFAKIPLLRTIQAPQHAAYFHFRADGAPPASYLVSLMEKAKKNFCEIGFKKRAQLVMAASHHETHVEVSCDMLANSIRKQWPNRTLDPRRLTLIDSAHLDVDRALADVGLEWGRLAQNHDLALYLDKCQEVLSHLATQESRITSYDLVPYKDTPAEQPTFYTARVRAGDDPSLAKLLQDTFDLSTAPNRPAFTTIAPRSCVGVLAARSGNVIQRPLKVHSHRSLVQSKPIPLHPRRENSFTAQSPELQGLKTIVTAFRDPTSFVQNRYAKELLVSIDALQKHVSSRKNMGQVTRYDINTSAIRPAKDYVTNTAEHVRRTLRLKHPQAKWLQAVGLWPKMTTVDLLTELRSTSTAIFGKGAKEALVAFELAVSRWQHLLRIQDAQKRFKKQQERDEWDNQGHTNWSALQYPDWLLLEIDGNILIRKEQVHVALATILSESGENSVLQLLMGKGKTSCILRKQYEEFRTNVGN